MVDLIVLKASRTTRLEKALAGLTVCRTKADVAREYLSASPRTWLSLSARLTDSLVVAAAARGPKPTTVVTVAAPRPASVPALRGLFTHVVGDGPDFRWLPYEELFEAIRVPVAERTALFVAAAVDLVAETVTLVRADFRIMVVPFSAFPCAGDGTTPDFTRFAVTDFGHTVAFGEYEAAADAILYEADPAYRRACRRQMHATEQTFGASLRRLRKQRQLTRSDFPPLAAKTIARIERNEVAAPHGKTLGVLAKRLGVLPDEIASY